MTYRVSELMDPASSETPPGHQKVVTDIVQDPKTGMLASGIIESRLEKLAILHVSMRWQ